MQYFLEIASVVALWVKFMNHVLLIFLCFKFPTIIVRRIEGETTYV